MAATNNDVGLVVSLVLSLISLVLLFGVTWYFQSSLDLLQQQVEYDRELLLKLQEQVNIKVCMYVAIVTNYLLPTVDSICDQICEKGSYSLSNCMYVLGNP